MPGYAWPWYSPVPEGFVAARRRTHIEHDLSKAKQLLSDAGYPNGLDVTMNVYDTRNCARRGCEQLKQAGIRGD